MSSHRSDRRLSQYLFSQLDHHLLPVLLVIGVAGACSHTQATEAPPAHPAVAVVQPTRRPPPPPPPPEPAAAPVENTKSSKELAVYFDFDSALLRDDARPVLQKVAAVAKNRALRIEGNCDEVGTVEYNLALGEHRAIQAKDYLTRLGIPAGRIKTVSYGSQHPKDPGHDDQAHAENRRDDFIVR
jgi:peptidoglycan-associated lipoprotein